MSCHRALINQLEKIAVQAWPGKIMKPYGSWLLRVNDGITKRANSVWTVGDIPREDYLEEIESFYRKYKLAPSYYISEVSPKCLKQDLLRANYEQATELYLLANEVKKLKANTSKHKDLQLITSREVTSAWMDAFLSLEAHDQEKNSSFQTIFDQIQLNKVFLSLKIEEDIVAVATVASGRGWGYISNVIVNEAFRRQGIATSLFYYIAQWAEKNDTKNVFMQVISQNSPALALYKKLGFTTVATSSYYVKEM